LGLKAYQSTTSLDNKPRYVTYCTGNDKVDVNKSSNSNRGRLLLDDNDKINYFTYIPSKYNYRTRLFANSKDWRCKHDPDPIFERPRYFHEYRGGRAQRYV
jgi:hypothetical protein